MKIRTIKPQFWQNRQLASLPAVYRLLAIGLLNCADDEGYFDADPMLVRAEVFPYEESTQDVRDGLRELDKIGFIDTAVTSDGRALGRVAKFSEHQRVDRPKPSRFRPLWPVLTQNDVATSEQQRCNVVEAATQRRCIAVATAEEGKGREREQGKEPPEKQAYTSTSNTSPEGVELLASCGLREPTTNDTSARYVSSGLPEPASAADLKRCLDAYDARYTAATSSPYYWSGADRGDLAELVQTQGVDVVLGRIAKFYDRATADPYWQKYGYAFRTFKGAWNALASWSPAQVRSTTPARADDAAQAWNEVLEAARRVGRTGTPQWSDPRIGKAVRAAGGFATVCTTDMAAQGPLRARFVEAWKEAQVGN